MSRSLHERSGLFRTCIFTIVSRNYLHFARTLMSSIKDAAPGVHMVVVLCDRSDSLSFEQELFDIIPIHELEIPNVEEFILRYSILELNTAVKPYAFTHILERGFETAIYFDPDIRLYGSLDEMCDIVERYNIVLVPHLTHPLDDGKRPDELDILRAGTYNLGYIGIRNASESQRFLQWWRQRLRTLCINDTARGLFVDQRWIDLVPGLFDGVKVIRHPGWNVAYWNISHRTIQRSAGSFTVNDEPLIFFHYSGFKPDDRVFSVHQNRFELQRLDPVVRELCESYAQELRQNDWDNSSKADYAFDRFDDGSYIPDVLRTAYRHYYPEGGELPEASFDTPPDWLVRLVNESAEFDGETSPFVSRLGYEIYRSRTDLQIVFPDIADTHARAFGEWFVSSVEDEYGLSPRFTEGVRIAINEESKSERTPGTLHRWLVLTYHASPILKAVIDRVIHPNLRWRMRRRARRILSSGNRQLANRTEMNGLNVIGYLCAESGTGEAVRSTLRAVNAAGIHVAALDVRYNNVSRMGELPPARITDAPRYGINLLHINADQTRPVLDHLGSHFYSGRYNIGFWFWELEEFPSEYRSAFESLDEVWVGSSFCQKAISKAAHVPVVHIPLCVELIDVPHVERQEIELPNDSFLILSILDLLSIPERKNPLGVMDVFRTVLADGEDDVHLVLKTSNLDRCDPDLRNVIRSFASHPSVTLIDNYLHRPTLNAIMNACDCYFSMHRSEGFGLPMAEAMYLEKPVVATGWSANMDFMNQNNSIPINYKLVELQQDHGPYRKGNFWAEADRDHAAQSLISLMNDSDLRSTLGKQASSDIKQYHSPATVGRSIKHRLDILAEAVNLRGYQQ